jgi:chorismate mutase
MSIKISLDGSAIEKLLKTDPEFVVALKKGVVENFTKRHIRSLLNFEEIKNEISECLKAHEQAKEAYLLAVRQEIEKEIGVIKRETWNSNKSIDVNPELLNHLTLHIKAYSESVFRDMMKKSVDEQKERLELHIDKLTQHYFDAGIQELVRQRFNKLLEENK